MRVLTGDLSGKSAGGPGIEVDVDRAALKAHVGTNVMTATKEGSFPYGAYHEGDTSLGSHAGNHKFIEPTVDREHERIGDDMVAEIQR